MDILFLDDPNLEARWEANEQELLRLAMLSPCDREIHAKREDELLDEQDAIEFRLGLDAAYGPSLKPIGL